MDRSKLFKYKILHSKEEVRRLNTSGLCFLVKDKSKIDDIMKSHFDFSSIYVELENGVLKLCYSGRRVIKDRESLKHYLLDKDFYDFFHSYSFRYKALLSYLLELCPNDQESVYPKDRYALENQGKKFWIDKPEGQIAMCILRTFKPEEMLKRVGTEFYDEYDEEEKDLKKKVGYILDYIKQENIEGDEDDVNRILEYIKEISPYTRFSYLIPLHSDVNKKILDVVSEDLESKNVYKYIFAIAAYPSFIDTEENSCFKKTLELLGYGKELFEVSSAMCTLYDNPIKIDSYEYRKLKLGEVLQEMFEQFIIGPEGVNKEYTCRQLVSFARDLICKKYMVLSAVTHIGKKCFITEIKCRDEFIAVSCVDGERREQSTDIEVENLVEPDFDFGRIK